MSQHRPALRASTSFFSRQASAAAGLAACAVALLCASAQAQSADPIAATGHGAFFDAQGHQIAPTAELITQAQAHYRTQLMSALPQSARARFAALQAQAAALPTGSEQARLVVEQRLLDWLLDRTGESASTARLRGRLAALRRSLTMDLARHSDPQLYRERTPFKLPSAVQAWLDRTPADRPGTQARRRAQIETLNRGQAYIDECVANQVPIPPTIGQMDPNGTSGWKSLGFLPPAGQFIVGTPAELRSFTSPQGLCFALPRYRDGLLNAVELDGVICQSRITSKVCYWDNQMNGVGFAFNAGARIPIGVPNLAIDPAGRYQAGGQELEFGDGGSCTDCHAGRNPYIVHPDLVLTNAAGVPTGLSMGMLNQPPLNLPTFPPSRHAPIVGPSWPQNTLAMSPALVPDVCSACHSGESSSGGAFPHLSSELAGYCNQVLDNAIRRTMPPGSPGSQARNPDVIAFMAWCGTAASAGPSNRGDPHLSTSIGTSPFGFDFQPAGEFVALRHSGTGFELQTRQTPVSTALPVPDANVGLDSCVSINTAVGFRLGKQRVTFQPAPGQPYSPDRLQLRVDGRVTELPPKGLSLSDRSRILPTSNSGIDLLTSDGSRVVVTPTFWPSQGLWYLNIEVMNSSAREGLMAPILPGQWLPLAPGGRPLGARPAVAMDRFNLLNRRFADAWRVTASTSLFDYGAGQGTAHFIDTQWPPVPGKACVSPLSKDRPVEPGTTLETAQSVCRPIQDKAAFKSCVSDVRATGELGFVDAYLKTLAARK